MSEHSETILRWINQVEEFRQSNSYRELTWNWWRTDSVRVAYSQGFIHWRSSRRSKKNLKDRNIEPEKFEDRIIFMSMFNDIDWSKRGHSERCIQIPNKSRITRRDSREDTGHSSALETKRSGMELSTAHLKVKADSIASQMVERFKETRINAFESWNSEMKKQQRHHTLQCGFFPRTKNSYFARCNQQINSISMEQSWRVRSEAEWERIDFWKVRGKRKWATTKACKAAWSECFGANSKEWDFFLQMLEW